jgi:hypothetical protein
VREAKSWRARLPFETIDLLIVDELGKNINGAGMDPLVIGRPTIREPADRPAILTEDGARRCLRRAPRRPAIAGGVEPGA